MKGKETIQITKKENTMIKKILIAQIKEMEKAKKEENTQIIMEKFTQINILQIAMLKIQKSF